MPKKIDITDKPGFSYFITTPCEEWDALEYHEEWCASKHPINKATITLAITRQLEWLMKEGSEEEKDLCKNVKWVMKVIVGLLKDRLECVGEEPDRKKSRIEEYRSKK